MQSEKSRSEDNSSSGFTFGEDDNDDDVTDEVKSEKDSDFFIDVGDDDVGEGLSLAVFVIVANLRRGKKKLLL